MKVGFMHDVLPNEQPTYHQLKISAIMAEQVGFDSYWVPDHLLFRVPGEKEYGLWDAMTVLSALAAVTNRISIGPLVACMSFRNPALLAKIADTLDEISEGRFILGVGAGWYEPEYLAFGYPFDHLASRFEEALQVLVPLLHKGKVDFTGRYAQARHTVLLPRGPSSGRIPIWIGSHGPRMLRLAATYADAWNTVWHLSPERVAEEYLRIQEACIEVGRDPSSLEFTAGTFARVLKPGEVRDPEEKAITGSVEEVARILGQFAEIGVKHLVVIILPPTAEEIERFLPVIDLVHQM